MWIRETRIEKKEKKDIKKTRMGEKEQEWQGWHEAHLHKELETSCNDRYVGRYGQVETQKKKDTKIEKRREGGGEERCEYGNSFCRSFSCWGGGGGIAGYQLVKNRDQ